MFPVVSPCCGWVYRVLICCSIVQSVLRVDGWLLVGPAEAEEVQIHFNLIKRICLHDDDDSCHFWPGERYLDHLFILIRHLESINLISENQSKIILASVL